MAKQNYIVKNGVAQPFPIPEAARPTFTEIRQVLRGYDEQGTLLPNAAIITDSESKVDILRCGTLYADTIDGVVIDVPEETWTNTTPTNITVGGLLTGRTLTGLSAIDILEQILYAFIPSTIQSFTLTGIDLVNDLGVDYSGQQKTFNYSIGTPSSSTSLSITYSNLINGTIATGISPSSTSYTLTVPQGFTSTTPGAQLSVTLTAIQSNNSYSNASLTRNIRWWSRCYYGKSTNGGYVAPNSLSQNGDFRIETTGSHDSGNFTIADGTGYVYFHIHQSRSITIVQGSNDVTSAFINLGTFFYNGIPYKVYRSAFLLNSSLQFKILST